MKSVFFSCWTVCLFRETWSFWRIWVRFWKQKKRRKTCFIFSRALAHFPSFFCRRSLVKPDIRASRWFPHKFGPFLAREWLQPRENCHFLTHSGLIFAEDRRNRWSFHYKLDKKQRNKWFGIYTWKNEFFPFGSLLKTKIPLELSAVVQQNVKEWEKKVLEAH